MSSEPKIYKLSEVAEHNKSKGDSKSIWVVIHDKVYDITKFMDEVKIVRVHFDKSMPALFLLSWTKKVQPVNGCWG